MGQDPVNLNTEIIELTEELSNIPGVRFDPNTVCLSGLYRDELSAFRAKRSWTEILGDNFLLEPEYDYEFSRESDFENSNFILNCTFLTACGRYAFWRLTNNQAPEAQYQIETAHIPNAELRHEDFIQAPDLRPSLMFPTDLIKEEKENSRTSLDFITNTTQNKFIDILRNLFFKR